MTAPEEPRAGTEAVPDELTGVLSADPPRFDEADVARIAREVFGFEGEVERRFESERDQNFLVAGADGDRRILKISNAGERADVLDMEVGAALHARRTDPTLPIATPRPIVRDAAVFVDTVRDEDRATDHMVRMFDHLPGRASSDGMRLDHEALWAYGETLARLGRALRGYFHPAADRVLLWSVEHCLALRPMMDAIEDDGRRALVRRAFDRYEAEVAPRWPALRAQVVHGDLTLDNALLDDENRITGIVDFGDMSHTALVADPVSALDSLAREPDRRRSVPRRRPRCSTATRRSRRSSPRSAAVIGEALLARVALTVVISAWRVRRFPENARYIQSWDDDAWSLLEALDRRSTPRRSRGGSARRPPPPRDRRSDRAAATRSSAPRSPR